MKKNVLLLILLFTIPVLSFGQWQTHDLDMSNNFYDVHFIDENNGWIAGDNTVLKTIDAGATWENFNTAVTDTRYYGVYFKNENNGWAVGKKKTSSTAGRVHFTNDGGETWQVYSTGGSLPWWSIAFTKDGINGVMVGQEGQIKYTSDGGSNWSNRVSPTGTAGIIKDVTFYDGLKGVAVGYSSPSVGFLMKTIDGGGTWETVKEDFSSALHSVSFMDSKNGIAVGSGGFVIRTVDGGVTWGFVPKPTEQTLNGVYYYDSLNSIAVGNGGTIIKSSDGGRNWVDEESNTTYTLRNVFKNKDEDAYAVGSLGTILTNQIEDFSFTVANKDTEIKFPKLVIENLSISADGSDMTLFNYVGSDKEDVELRIKENTSDDSDFFGKFSSGVIEGDTLKINYSHPKYYKEPDGDYPNNQYKFVTLQIWNSSLEKVKKEFPINIVRPSVLMVHGIWSNSLDSFGSMQKYLTAQGLYTKMQTLKVDYKSDQFNFESAPVYIRYKKALKAMARMANISMGKFDVLAHSNGGILSRQYIQSSDYKDDINKLITYNTPHSGSQLPNLLLDPDFFVLHPVLEANGMNSTNGVISDLKVDGDFIKNLNSSGAMTGKYSKIGVHTITSTETVDNIVGYWDAVLVYYLKFHWEEALDYALENYVFNSPFHDVIVALDSQIGGCTSTTLFEGQMHSGSTSNVRFQDKAIELLNQSPSDINYFSLNGYNPPTLTTGFNSLKQSQIKRNSGVETITLNSPVDGAEFKAGQTVNITANGSVGINNIVSSMGVFPNSLQSHITENSSNTNFSFTIPNNAFGRLEIVTAGFSANGYEDHDTTYIMVTTDAILETIEIDQSLILVPEGNESVITVLGHYDDGEIRNISNISDLVYSFEKDYAEITESGFVTGITEGEDILTVNYLGKTANVPIAIVEFIALDVKDDIIQDNSFTIFPNPTRNKLTIILPANQIKAEVSIYNLLGQNVLSNKINSSENDLDISNLQNGMYLIKIKTKTKTVTKRVIKQ